MKKINILLIIFFSAILVSCGNANKSSEPQNQEEDVAVVDMHTSQNSLDWTGKYKGTLPCADCEGIETTVELNQDLTFKITQKYLGKSDDDVFTETGSFKWNEEGSNVELETSGRLTRYKVGENQLIMLDADGNIITGDLAEYYILRKEA